jgi:hypothetical protein
MEAIRVKKQTQNARQMPNSRSPWKSSYGPIEFFWVGQLLSEFWCENWDWILNQYVCHSWAAWLDELFHNGD